MGVLTFSHTLYKIMHEIYIYCFVYYFIDITSEALWQKTDLQKQHLKKLIGKQPLTDEELAALLNAATMTTAFFAEADLVRRQVYGDTVFCARSDRVYQLLQK